MKGKGDSMNDVVKRAEEWLKTPSQKEFNTAYLVRDLVKELTAIRTLCGELPDKPSQASTVELVRNVCGSLIKAGERIGTLEELISEAAPLAWEESVSGIYADNAHEWEKKAEKLLAAP